MLKWIKGIVIKQTGTERLHWTVAGKEGTAPPSCQPSPSSPSLKGNSQGDSPALTEPRACVWLHTPLLGAFTEILLFYLSIRTDTKHGIFPPDKVYKSHEMKSLHTDLSPHSQRWLHTSNTGLCTISGETREWTQCESGILGLVHGSQPSYCCDLQYSSSCCGDLQSKLFSLALHKCNFAALNHIVNIWRTGYLICDSVNAPIMTHKLGTTGLVKEQ